MQKRLALSRKQRIPFFHVSHPKTEAVGSWGHVLAQSQGRDCIYVRPVITSEDNEHGLGGQRCYYFSKQREECLKATVLFLTLVEPCREQEKGMGNFYLIVLFLIERVATLHNLLWICCLIHLSELQTKTDDIHVMRGDGNLK